MLRAPAIFATLSTIQPPMTPPFDPPLFYFFLLHALLFKGDAHEDDPGRTMKKFLRARKCLR